MIKNNDYKNVTNMIDNIDSVKELEEIKDYVDKQIKDTKKENSKNTESIIYKNLKEFLDENFTTLEEKFVKPIIIWGAHRYTGIDINNILVADLIGLNKEELIGTNYFSKESLIFLDCALKKYNISIYDKLEEGLKKNIEEYRHKNHKEGRKKF